jgi:hypothetical protein
MIKKFSEFIKINESNGPDDDSCVISSNGYKYSVGCEGKFLGDFVEMEDALKFVKKWMDDNGYYPNLWFVSDHGNSWQIDIEGNEIENNDVEEGEWDIWDDDELDPAGGHGLYSHE